MKIEIIKHKLRSRHQFQVGETIGIFKIIAPAGNTKSKTGTRLIWHVQCIKCGFFTKRGLLLKHRKIKKCNQCRIGNFILSGCTYTLSELCKKHNVNRAIVRNRVDRGMNISDALQVKTKIPYKIEYKGEMLNFAEISRITGIYYHTLIFRYHSGKRGDDLFSLISLKDKYGQIQK